VSAGPVIRRLAAILAADVVGYSRMIGADEPGTLARLQAALRAEIARVADRTFNRLGTLVAVVAGLLFAALHMWPPH
jgi:adenylate cyclase